MIKMESESYKKTYGYIYTPVKEFGVRISRDKHPFVSVYKLEGKRGLNLLPGIVPAYNVYLSWWGSRRTVQGAMIRRDQTKLIQFGE